MSLADQFAQPLPPAEGGHGSTERSTVSTTTKVEYAGHDKTPIVILDNVLSDNAYMSLLHDFRSRNDFLEGHANGVNFPGKIGLID